MSDDAVSCDSATFRTMAMSFRSSDRLLSFCFARALCDLQQRMIDAVYGGRVDKVRELIDSGIDIDAADSVRSFVAARRLFRLFSAVILSNRVHSLSLFFFCRTDGRACSLLPSTTSPTSCVCWSMRERTSTKPTATAYVFRAAPQALAESFFRQTL